MYAALSPPSIRRLNEDDVISAAELAWRVFSEFEAPEYSEEGIAEFQAYIEPSFIVHRMTSGRFWLWGAFERGKLVGVIAIKPPLHISLLFVDKQYHRRGIARSLLGAVLNSQTLIAGHDRITVNSSPYAVKIYQCLGFAPTDTEQTVNGLRFTPMESLLKVD